MTRNRNIGLLSAFIISVYPIVFGYQRFFMLDFALTAVVTTNILCLLHTENFSRIKPSLIFGMTLGLGMLTKWSFPIFIIGPFFVSSWRGIKVRKLTILNIVMALSLGFLISLIYYNHPICWLKAWFSGKSYTYISPSIWQTSWRTFSGITFYIRSLFWQLTPFFYFLFFVMFFLLLKSNIRYKLFLTLWLLCPITILTFIPNKWPRHIMPSLPAIALITAIGISQIKKKKIKTLILIFVLTVGLIQYLIISYGKVKNVSFLFMYDVTPPSVQEMQLRRTINQLISRYILPHTQNDKKKLQIGVVDTVPQMIIVEALTYSVLQKNLNCQIISLHRDYFYFPREKNKFDFLIIIRNKSTFLPTESEIQNFFVSERIDKFINLKETEYGFLAQELKNLIKKMRMIDVIEVPLNNEYNKIYFYIFSRED